VFAIIVNPVVSPPLWLTSSNGSHQESGKFGALAVSCDLGFRVETKDTSDDNFTMSGELYALFDVCVF
jgi:hypothetical protein